MSKPRRFPVQVAIALAGVTVFSAARPAPGSQPVERNGATTQRRGVKAEKMAGPWKSMEVVCAALRKSICKEWVEQFSPAEPDSDTERPRATCSRVEVPVQGALRPPYLEAQGLRATCGLQGGSTVGR